MDEKYKETGENNTTTLATNSHYFKCMFGSFHFDEQMN